MVEELQRHGYQAYLVGGCVRDLLADIEPKDFDVATDATPEQVKRAFRSCRLIGRRFRLAHIHFGRDYIEVATFRGSGNGDDRTELTKEGRLLADNVYGSIDEDAVRRDFTVNALYLDPQRGQILDYVSGYRDVRARTLRLIGDPEARYREDPVRLLRAVRFAAKLDFTIEPRCAELIATLGTLLKNIPPARLFEEALKLFLSGHARRSFDLLQEYGLFRALFADTAAVLDGESGAASLEMLRAGMANTDERIASGKPVTPAFMFATLLWPAMRRHQQQLEAQGHTVADAIHMAAEWAVFRQVARISIPRRFSTPMREIWQLQPRFENRHGKRVGRLMSHPRFRAAYDFLLLRVLEDESLEPLAKFWTEAQSGGAPPSRTKSPPRRRRRGRRGRRRGRTAPES